MFLPKLLALVAGTLTVLTSASDNNNDELVPRSDILSPSTGVEQRSNDKCALGSDCGCGILKTFFKEKVLTPGSNTYKTTVKQNWDLSSVLKPRCIFVPTTANEVAQAVVVLKTCKAPFAIRAGGHMPIRGASNIDGGVLISLRKLTAIQISKDGKSVEAGAGLVWYQLYGALDSHGLVVIGGRSREIGISGLTLGGGVSFMGTRYGFSMDNVLAYEIVIANGTVLQASSTKNKDLFWALKGGGNNFGIVTKLTYKTYKIPKISTLNQIHAGTAVDKFIPALTNFANHHEFVDSGSDGLFITVIIPSTNPPTIILQSQGVSIGEKKNPPVFKNLTSIPSISSKRNVTSLVDWIDVQANVAGVYRSSFSTHSMHVDEHSVREMWKMFKAAVLKMGHIKGLVVSMNFQPISRSALRVAKTNEIGNIWGLDDCRPYLWWVISVQYTDSKDDQEVHKFQSTLREQIHAANKKRGTADEHLYYNDAAGDQDAFATFPKENLKRLRKIRGKYDPQLVFTELVQGGFKIDGKKVHKRDEE